MTLSELAMEYREGARLIKGRILELEKTLTVGELSEVQQYLLMSRIRLLASMKRDMTDVAIYLERHYCGRRR